MYVKHLEHIRIDVHTQRGETLLYISSLIECSNTVSLLFSLYCCSALLFMRTFKHRIRALKANVAEKPKYRLYMLLDGALYSHSLCVSIFHVCSYSSCINNTQIVCTHIYTHAHRFCTHSDSRECGDEHERTIQTNWLVPFFKCI